jgi:glycosyltransferase involved in cell wall biosynthesis
MALTQRDDSDPLVLPTREATGIGEAARGISLVMPAYNEAASIPVLIPKARAILSAQGAPFEIIVVDDGSTDGTAARARELGAQVVSHPCNRGYGNSLKSGFLAARYENVIICDADQSYPLEQLPLLLEEADRYQMVVGARKGALFNGSLFKRIGRRLQLGLVRFTVGFRVPDANSGFRLIKRSVAIRYFDWVCAGFSFTTSITIGMLCEQYCVKFVPIDYLKREGQSQVRYFRDTLRSLQIILQSMLRFNPIKAFLALGGFALVPMLFFLILALFAPVMLLGSALFAAVFLLIQALGMLAYCVNRRPVEGTVDAGLQSWARVVMETPPAASSDAAPSPKQAA